MLQSRKPVIGICAVRTGAGKSQTTRRIARLLRDRGVRTALQIKEYEPHIVSSPGEANLRMADVAVINKIDTVVRTRHELQEIGPPDLAHVVDEFLRRLSKPLPASTTHGKVTALVGSDRTS